MGRLILWAAIGFFVWWMLRGNRRVPPPPGSSPVPPNRNAPPAAPEAMVDCARCGLHFPASEAVRDGARVFCCTAHRDAGPAA